MNKLQEVFIGWTIYRSAFHTDIIKMYSTILIRREHWVFQQYLWENSLDPAKQCQEKVIKTIMYGVCWSGNQAERKLRMTTEISRSRYPQIYEIISRGIYVDDCTSGSNSENEILNIADKLKMVLNSGGFSLKGLAFSSKDPPESWIPSRWWCQYSHSRNEMVHTRWFASIWFHRHEFQQKNKKKECASKGIPAILTRCHCVSKVAEIYDLAGKLTPLIASLEINLHKLVKRNLQWDDAIPDNLRAQWISLKWWTKSKHWPSNEK